MFLLKRDYFNKTLIIKGLITALLFSASLYLSYFGLEYKIINTIFGITALYFLLTIKRAELFYAGFFIALFWFYWISFSFSYYDLTYLVPVVIIGLGLFYGLLFLSISFFNRVEVRALLLFAISFIEPFTFNWLKIELLFVNSYLGITKLSLAFILLAVVLLIKKKKILFTIPILIAYFIQPLNSVKESDLKIYLPEYSFSQEYKWNKNNLNEIINENLKQIDYAIANNKDVVILPETTFPLILNKNENLLSLLLEKSKKISIIAGGLFYENKEYKNSTYFFQNSVLKTAHKVVLVPFGEAIPLPEKVKNFINDTFYDGADDYVEASSPTDFNIKKTFFRNAICYETTKDEIYENLEGVKYVIATSNNAWFTPSIEPTLQRLLMKYYAKKYDVIIYHSANGSRNEVITP